MNSEIREIWNSRYNTGTYIYGTRPNDFLRRSVKMIPPGEILCLGEGEGRNAVYLARKGYPVTAVDISDIGLAKVKRLAQESNVKIETVWSDLFDYQITPGKWSGIISIFCHVPADLRIDLHRRVTKGLAPGGIFILESYTPEQLKFKTGGPPTQDLLVTLKDLEKELSGLTILHGVERERIVSEGNLHTGMAAVVQIIAKKPATKKTKAKKTTKPKTTAKKTTKKK